MYQLNEVVKYLIDEGYVSFTKKKLPVFTKKFNEEFSGISQGFSNGLVVHPDSLDLVQVYKPEEYEKVYIQFLIACDIPKYCYDTYGRPYSVNKYSEEGLKAFKKALESGYKLDVLQVTVSLYYKSKVALKKAVGNYIVSGEWKTDYDRLLKEAEAGNLETYVKSETTQRRLPTPFRV